MRLFQTLKYLFFRFVLRKQYLIAREKKYSNLLKFKIEDTIGRRIYKNGYYEKELSDFIDNSLNFEAGDIALDIGANIGWYSLLLDKKMPDGCVIYAFEPDPMNFQLLLHNIRINGASKVKAVNKALSNKNEVTKLYRYSNKNLGRHSLLDINHGEVVGVEAVILDEYLTSNNINIEKIKFAKIDIEGYEYFALSGAEKVLASIRCLISEFVPRFLKHAGIEPMHLIGFLENKGFKPHVFNKGVFSPAMLAEILECDSCDLIWLKNQMYDNNSNVA